MAILIVFEILVDFVNFCVRIAVIQNRNWSIVMNQTISIKIKDIFSILSSVLLRYIGKIYKRVHRDLIGLDAMLLLIAGLVIFKSPSHYGQRVQAILLSLVTSLLVLWVLHDTKTVKVQDWLDGVLYAIPWFAMVLIGTSMYLYQYGIPNSVFH